MIPTLIAVSVVVFVLLLIMGIYNRLVKLRNVFKNAFAQIDVQLKRRYDLIPNLVETAKGYIKHERETLEAVIVARNQASQANNKAVQNVAAPDAVKDLSGAEGVLTGAMSRMFAVMESYPDLKANQTMARLMEELSSTENKVSFARQAYNDAVMVYNTSRETFPNVLIAGPLGFAAAELFEVSAPEQREAVKVSFAS